MYTIVLIAKLWKLIWKIILEYSQVRWNQAESQIWHFSKQLCALSTSEWIHVVKSNCMTSLMVQIRICLLQGAGVRSLVQEYSVSHNYWAHTLELVSPNCWAHAPRACGLQQEKLQQWEACAPQWRVPPSRHNWRKPTHSNKDPVQPKINKIWKQ